MSIFITCAAGTSPLRAVEGDIVTLHWTCCNENGEVLESSIPSNEPATFEVGAGNIVGNRIFEAFDEAVRGLAVGETVSVKVSKHANKSDELKIENKF